MKNEVGICRGCGKEILEGKYCKMCADERKEKREKNRKLAGECLGILGGFALMFLPKVLGKKK